MLLGIVFAFIVVLASIAIPGIHLAVTVPLGPFLAGFIGGSVAKASDAQVLWFGTIVTALSSLPLIGGIVWALVSPNPVLGIESDWLLIILAVLILPYIWFSVTLGALINYLILRRQRKTK